MSTRASEAHPQPEAWLRGPVEGVPAYLMPAAHALIQAMEEVECAVADLSTAELWERPGGAAAVGFHLRHIAGAADRLLTYARGEVLSEEQRAALTAEGEPGEPPEDAAKLIEGVRAAVESALGQFRRTPPETLLDARAVGRKQLPSTVLGLLSHAAEHAQRHAGQALTTAKVVRGARA